MRDLCAAQELSAIEPSLCCIEKYSALRFRNPDCSAAKDLATLRVYMASGSVRIPYIEYDTAKQLQGLYFVQGGEQPESLALNYRDSSHLNSGGVKVPVPVIRVVKEPVPVTRLDVEAEVHTSPSLTMYSLPSRRNRPASFAPCSPLPAT